MQMLAARGDQAGVVRQYDVAGAIPFGSRARGDYWSDSDANIAVLLEGEAGEFFDTQRVLSGIAYDVLLDTDIRIQALPIWQAEWDHPYCYSNPYLFRNIRQEGIPL